MSGPIWNRALLALSMAVFLFFALPQLAGRLRDLARAPDRAARRGALEELIWVLVALAVVLGLTAWTWLA